MFSSLSLHELTACIYYKIAIERGLRGCDPDSELLAHQQEMKDRDDRDDQRATATAGLQGHRDLTARPEHTHSRAAEAAETGWGNDGEKHQVHHDLEEAVRYVRSQLAATLQLCNSTTHNSRTL